MAFLYANPNPLHKKIGDCVIRALSIALTQSWEDTYKDLAVLGMELGDLPSSNAVWGEYLRQRGYEKTAIPNSCPECYTIADFCKDHPEGVYILCTGSHVVASVDGNYMDSWDSGDEVPIISWKEKEK